MFVWKTQNYLNNCRILILKTWYFLLWLKEEFYLVKKPFSLFIFKRKPLYSKILNIRIIVDFENSLWHFVEYLVFFFIFYDNLCECAHWKLMVLWPKHTSLYATWDCINIIACLQYSCRVELMTMTLIIMLSLLAVM